MGSVGLGSDASGGVSGLDAAYHGLVFDSLRHMHSACGGGREPLRRLLQCIRDHTGIHSVGIRYKNGRDFPYYETMGFSRAFVEAESSLVSQGDRGAPAGCSALECMCGAVISGRTDPMLPFFTPHGTFWTNSTTGLLLASTTEGGPGRTRNRCHQAGYESVALTPFYSDGRCVGLIQFNDLRPGMFSPAIIQAIEYLSHTLGMYLGTEGLRARVAELEMEREALIQEVENRVNNNLQVVASLIRLQSEYCFDERDRFVFKGNEQRVLCLGRIQNKLYGRKGHSSVPMGAFVAELVRDAISHSGVRDVSVEVDAGDVELAMERAMPLGMLLNEMLSNSIEHAFDGVSGHRNVQVLLGRQDGGLVRMIYRDNGRGMEADRVDLLEPATFGFRLMGVLTRQLGARVDVATNMGAGLEYEVCFLA